MATYIRDDLAVRLRSGTKLPAPLTLAALADHYGVSFTPVRSAVRELIAEGLLEKGPNRRLVAKRPAHRHKPSGRNAKPPEPPRDPFERVTDDLVRLSLQGEPLFLREEATAEKYGISRSSLRNILHRLAGSGMVDHIPRRGWRLRPFRQEDMQAFLEVREVLELKALELAQPHLADEDLRKLLDRNRVPSSREEPPCIDDSLHAYLIEKSGNAYIKDFFDRHGPYYTILFDWEDQDRQTAIETARQHRDILTALLDKDWQAARQALSHHIRWNHPILSKIRPACKKRTGSRDKRAE